MQIEGQATPQSSHVCDEKAAVIILANNQCVPDTPENKIKYKEEERGWSVACSVCGNTAFEDSLRMYI